jgi:hypothetical protein
MVGEQLVPAPPVEQLPGVLQKGLELKQEPGDGMILNHDVTVGVFKHPACRVV